MSLPQSPLKAPLKAMVFGSAALVGLAALTAPARALEPKEMIETAKVACLESAGKNGWQTEVAEVISARTLDSDRVEVVFNLTRDGSTKARLTCPYSISKGVIGTLGEAAAGVVEPAATPDLGVPVDRNKAWWLLLPIGLGLLSWAALRAKDGDAAYTSTASGYTTTPSGAGAVRGVGGVGDGHWLAEAAARDGLLEVREHADGSSAVLHRVRNGDSVSLTGVRRGEWLELSQGGWVREIEVRYDSGRVVFR